MSDFHFESHSHTMGVPTRNQVSGELDMEDQKEEGILNLSWVSGMSHWSGDIQCGEAPEDHIWK